MNKTQSHQTIDALEKLLSLKYDATPCGKGWEGTKPPGCKRKGKTTATPSPTKPSAKQPASTSKARSSKQSVAKTSHTTTEEDRRKYAESMADRDTDRQKLHNKFMKQAKKQFPTPPPYPEEVAALKWYTDDGYSNMNKRLRKMDSALKGYEKEDADSDNKMAVAALSALPPHEGTVYRAAYIPSGSDQAKNVKRLLDQYKPGQIYTEKGFLSTGQGKVPKDFEDGQIHYVIKSKTGKAVKNLSAKPKEDEVLFMPNTSFKVLAKESSGGKHTIYLEEV